MEALATYLKIAIRALRANLFRSFLTTLSILIGGFSIVVMSSLAAGGLATLSRGIEELGGARLILIFNKGADRARNKSVSYNRGLTPQDRDVLFAAVPHLAAKTRYSSPGQLDVSADGGHYVKTDIVSADGNFFDLFNMHIAKGRAFTNEENRTQAHVCVVGAKLANRIFDGDAVGKELTRNRDDRYLVVGQLADEEHFGVGFGFDWRDLAIFPLATMAAYTPQADKDALFVFKTDDSKNNDIVKRITNAILAERHNGVDDYEFIDFAGFMDKWHQLIGIMEGIVGFIAGIALLVGGVGVMNMMLVSVSERVREIGIRKALGASQAAIRTQFLCEAMLLSGFGGALGAGLGIVTALALGPMLRTFTPSWVNVIATGAALNALIVSISIGLLFGYFPARRAAKLDAIMAMRR